MKLGNEKYTVPTGIISSRKIFVFVHVIIVSRHIVARGGVEGFNFARKRHNITIIIDI